MCGRISTVYEWKDIEDEFSVDKAMADFRLSYNVAPSQQIPVIVAGSVIFDTYKWGLIPKWAKDDKFNMINARAETIEEKPWFKEAFINFRCLVPISSFFEWNKSKTPYLIKLKKRKVFALAGICSIWKPKNKNQIGISTVSLITTEANNHMQKIHHRMPIIIEKKNYKKWIDPKNTDIEKLKKFLKPYDSDKMESWVVSKEVGSPKNNYPEIIEKVEIQGKL